jgi:AcrR family transcriptional regulator
MVVTNTKRRFTPAEGRERALEAARALMLQQGPQAVTLKAVAARIGRTHANLIHHFGSAAALQRALAVNISRRIVARIGKAVLRVRDKQADPREVVDATFDAFRKEGVGPLAAWMMLTGQRDVLDPILQAMQRLIEELHAEEMNVPLQHHTLGLVLSALGYSLLGHEFAAALGLPLETSRDIAADHLRLSLIQAYAAQGVVWTGPNRPDSSRRAGPH